VVTYMLPLTVITIQEYLDPNRRSLFAKWFATLNAPAAAKVATAVIRIEQGNFSNLKGVGAGVYESRIDFGPGYRIYFGKDGETVVILLGGGTKKPQSEDIVAAQNCWQDFKARKVKET
jgi:putative addiction module killer protein